MSISGIARIQAAFSRSSGTFQESRGTELHGSQLGAGPGGPGMLSPLLNLYFTAGDPRIDSTGELLLALSDAKVDFIELGLPYSDPLADGPTIQMSAQAALQGGITLDKIFEQVAELRSRVDPPILAMGYYNQMLRYGPERFLDACVQAGIDGLIIPDLPIETYRDQFREAFEQRELGMSFLVTPRTPPARVQEIDALCRGFLYVVSGASTTGSAALNGADLIDYLKRLSEMDLISPRLVGFNIRNREDLQRLLPYAAGGIIGSAFIQALDADDVRGSAMRFVERLRG